MTSKTHMHQTSRTDAVPMLRWILRRNGAAITCELDAAGDNVYEVCVVPHWNVAATTIERFTRPVGAFERHAEIARHLREVGWVVVDHAMQGQVGIAA